MSAYFVANREQLQRVHVALDKVDLPFKLTLARGGKRSLSQNAYLWGVCYQTILDHNLGEQGWTNDDLHDFLLMKHFGHDTIEGFGMRRHKPLNHSSSLSTVEFADYVAFIQQFAAEHGIYIPDPEEQ